MAKLASATLAANVLYNKTQHSSFTLCMKKKGSPSHENETEFKIISQQQNLYFFHSHQKSQTITYNKFYKHAVPY